MKIILLIYFSIILCLCLSGFVVAQNNNPLNKVISVDLKNATQEEALEALIKVHQVQLAYSNNFMSKEKRITIAKTKITVNEALKIILEGTGLKIVSVEGDRIIIALDKYANANNNSIKGIITDAQTGEVLTAVSVFLNGTTFGKASDGKGYYEITNIPKGFYELVVSMLGYNMEKRDVTIDEKTKYIVNVSLTQKDIELKEIEVAGVKSKEWYENMEIFKRIFIGKSKFSDECRIQNEDDVYFLDNKEDSTLEARTVKPLVLINNALGYKLECFIEKLTYNRRTKDAFIKSNTIFEELHNDDKDKLEEWKENRVKAYQGSIIHYFVSLTKGKARAEGFKTYDKVPQRIIFNPNTQARKVLFGGTPEMLEEVFISYLSQNKEYFFLAKNMVVDYKGSLSAISVVSRAMCVDENGYPKEDSLFRLFGLWAEKGMADLLPRFYEKSLEK